MTTVWRWFSRILLVLLAMLALLAAVWAYGRLTSPTPEQQAAIAEMQARAPMPEGDNGFELLMALPAAPADGAPPLPVCGDGTSCIDVIESAPEQSSAAIVAWRPWLEANARALRAPAFRDLRTDASVADSLPAYRGMVQLRLLRAFDFATGQTAAALEAACEDARGAIRRASDPDILIDGMIGIAMFRLQAALIADMRRRAPQDPLPTSCAALAEPPDPAVEGTLCPGMRGEWRWLARVVDDLNAQGPSDTPEWATPLLHDPDWLLARAAERYAPHCTEAAVEAAREDRPTGFAHVAPRWVDHVSHPVSLTLDTIAEPAYTPYAERQLDHVAWRRLLAALLRMEAMETSLTNAQRFEALPAELRDGPRPLRFDADAHALRVALRGRQHDGTQGGEAMLPLPRRAAAAGAGSPEPLAEP